MKAIIAAAALSLLSSGAWAQSVETTTSQSTVAQPAPMVPPPPAGVLSTSRETHAVDAYGDRHDAASTSYTDSTGARVDRSSSSTTTVGAPPPPPPVTTPPTTTESSSTTGGQ